ncbi:MAG: SRPBCC family protein [Pseudomonadota bacterium]|nr:SRPBCC family protein [Pseudomonadota bacterium]
MRLSSNGYSRGTRRIPLVAALLLASRPVAAETLDDLLARGELTLLETKPDGRLRQVTAMGLVRAPIDVVWAKLTNLAAYETWMPQVADSTVVSTAGNVVVADFSIAVVGPNVNFRQKLTLDPTTHTIQAEWVSGALGGSRWSWQLEARDGATLVRRMLYTNVVDTNWIVRAVESEHHTMEYGINVATGVVELRGLKTALGVP